MLGLMLPDGLIQQLVPGGFSDGVRGHKQPVLHLIAHVRTDLESYFILSMLTEGRDSFCWPTLLFVLRLACFANPQAMIYGRHAPLSGCCACTMLCFFDAENGVAVICTRHTCPLGGEQVGGD